MAAVAAGGGGAADYGEPGFRKGGATARGALWFYSLLWKKDDMRCRAPIVHTITFSNGRASRWLWSDETGMVQNRPRMNDPTEIQDRLRSQAMISKSNMDGAVAVLRMRDGSSRTVGDEELDRVMTAWPESGSLLAIHSYIHARGGDGTVYRCKFELMPGPDGQLQP